MTEPLRVGVVGAGAIAQVAHLPVLSRMDGVEIVAICDNDLPKAQALAGRFEVSNTFDDIEDLLKYSAPDAVVICTPNHLHGIHVETALSAGAHVLCERPLALNPGAVAAVIRAQERAQRAVVVGMNYRYRSDVQAVRGFLSGSELGTIHTIRGGWYAFRPSRQGFGWRRQVAQSGGGALLDLGLGLIDLALWLAGDTEPDRVSATVFPRLVESEIDDAACALISCQDGPSILVDVSWHHVGESERFWFEVHGTAGTAAISPLSVYKVLHGSPVNVTPTGASGRQNAFTSSYAAEWANFLATARGDVAAPALEEQLTNHRVLETLYRAARTGTTEPVREET